MQMSHHLQKETEKGTNLEKGLKEFWEAMKIFDIMIVVMVSEAHTYFKTDQMAQFKDLLYFNYISKIHLKR